MQNNVYLNQARVKYSYDDLRSTTGKKQYLYLIGKFIGKLFNEQFIIRNSNRFCSGAFGA